MNINLSRPNSASIDISHGVLIFGTMLSAKPEKILEIGIGTGFITNFLLDGISYNQKGILTSIDNFYDLGGNLPNHVLQSLKQKNNINIIAPIEEKEFVLSSKNDEYDFLVSDGDHVHSGEWVDEIFRIMSPNAFMFFHDVNNSGFPGLMNYKILADKYNKPNYLFTQSSRNDEQCHRGLLMVINTK